MFISWKNMVHQLEEHDSVKWQQLTQASFQKFDVDRDGYITPEELKMEARRLFKEPLVCVDDEQLQIKWTAPDEEGLLNFLVTENGFNSDRVTKAVEKIKASKNKSTQNRLESFFKPVVSTSVPPKRKETNEKAAKESPNKKAKAGAGKRKK